MEVVPSITKEFLEKILARKVESFIIKPGTNVGDNYMSVIYSLEVKVQKGSETETLYLLSKCYPNNPTRQKFLNKSNMFWNEYSVYKVLIPELDKLYKVIGCGENLLFPPLVSGNGIDFCTLQKQGDTTYRDKVFDPFDIYIMMTDIRKTWGFRMADRQTGLNFDEMKLVIGAQARLHALSWGYKKLHNLNSLVDKFDFLAFHGDGDNVRMFTHLMGENIIDAAEAVETVFGKGSVLGNGIRKIKAHVGEIIQIVFLQTLPEQCFYNAHRVPPTQSTNEQPEEPWRVLLHGDCWTNNLMFRYDETTLKPIEVILVDLQRTKEHCPTLDLVNLFYCSTTTEFRKAHLETLLELYFEQFTSYCQKIGVPTMPNFTLKELKRRYHRSKIFGFLYSNTVLTSTLKDAKDIVDMETIKANDTSDLFQSFSTEHGQNNVYISRIVATATELHEEGVL